MACCMRALGSWFYLLFVAATFDLNCRLLCFFQVNNDIAIWRRNCAGSPLRSALAGIPWYSLGVLPLLCFVTYGPRLYSRILAVFTYELRLGESAACFSSAPEATLSACICRSLLLGDGSMPLQRPVKRLSEDRLSPNES